MPVVGGLKTMFQAARSTHKELQFLLQEAGTKGHILTHLYQSIPLCSDLFLLHDTTTYYHKPLLKIKAVICQKIWMPYQMQFSCTHCHVIIVFFSEV